MSNEIRSYHLIRRPKSQLVLSHLLQSAGGYVHYYEWFMYPSSTTLAEYSFCHTGDTDKLLNMQKVFDIDSGYTKIYKIKRF